MDIFKQASKTGLRFTTNKGPLSVEQLWTLSLSDLDTLAVSLETAYEASKGKSFLDKKTTKSVGLKLQFDIVLEILNTKVAEAEEARTARETKEHNNKILTLISQKKEGELANKSIEELEAMLKN